MKFPALLAVLPLTLSACSAPQHTSGSRQAGEQWLFTKTQAPAINLTGKWRSPEFGYAAFVQGDARINGQLDKYTAYGRASGSKAYLLLSDGAQNYYTAILSMPNKNEMTGFYSTSVPFDPANQKAVHFRLQ
ncbi:MAG: hypothetical protein ABI615_02805 [Chthoniobacterales bacterium]